MFSTLLAVNVYTNLDNVMLGFIKGDYQVGIYHTAVRIQTILSSLVSSIGGVLMPRLSYYVEKGREQEFFSVLRKSYRVLLMLSVPVAAYFILFAKESVLLIAGSSYMDAVLPMQIIMFTVVTTAMSNIIGMQIFIPLGRENAFMKAVLCGALIDLILNALLMPSLGAIGAAVATLAAQITQFLMQVVQAREYITKIFDVKSAVTIACTTGLSGIASVTAYKFTDFNAFFTLCISASIFFGMYIIVLWLIDYKELTETIEQFSKGKIRRHRKVV
jgi:O-antigen/teichoic acid export membrane protein